MRRAVAVVSAVSAAAFCAAACATPTGAGPGRAPLAPALAQTTAAATPTAPLPTPESLADVMYRLADPAVNGADKLTLVEGSAPPDAEVFARFAAALRDGGFAPVAFTASDTRWADPPALGATPQEPRALATIKVTSGNTPNGEGPGEFVFPMAFHPGPAGWQLTRDTAEMLLAFGNER